MRLMTLLALASPALISLALSDAPLARDLGQWEGTDQAVREWYARQMMPDHPTTSCCGEADAYWADTYTQEDGKYVAIITDDRADEPLHRPHIDIGTRIVIPQEKLKFGANDPNPTGHGVIFIGAGGVYCYLPPSGT